MEKTTTLDREWIHLMKEARDQGFSIEEIRDFLKSPQILPIIDTEQKKLAIK